MQGIALPGEGKRETSERREKKRDGRKTGRDRREVALNNGEV